LADCSRSDWEINAVPKTSKPVLVELKENIGAFDYTFD
jgi:hypothetical protein